MGLPTAYLVTTKNLDGILNALLSAKAPERLTGSFLKTLGFTSSNDSLFIKLFREIGLIDASGIPTEKYYRFLDQSEAKKVMAECVEEGYSDLFALNKKAYDLSEIEVKNKLKTLTQGTKEDNILALMAKTFKALSDYADWNKSKMITPTAQAETKTTSPKVETHIEENILERKIKPSLHYNIEIHLPETRDPAVYDAIFKSLKEHLI
jgi:hypothetical protein